MFEEWLLSYARPKAVWKNLVIMVANAAAIFVILSVRAGARGVGAGGGGRGRPGSAPGGGLLTPRPPLRGGGGLCGATGAHVGARARACALRAPPCPSPPTPPPHPPPPQSPLEVMYKCVLVGALFIRPQLVSRPAAAVYDALAALLGGTRAQAELAQRAARGGGSGGGGGDGGGGGGGGGGARPSVWRAA